MKKHLIVGLGNVGESYLYTRHNIGFEILNYFAHQYEQSFLEKRYGHICNVKIKNQNITLILITIQATKSYSLVKLKKLQVINKMYHKITLIINLLYDYKMLYQVSRVVSSAGLILKTNKI